MQRFNLTQHFNKCDQSRGLIMQPKPSGIELICQYWQAKYKTNIVQPLSGYMRGDPKQAPFPLPQESENLSLDLLEKYIKLARAQLGDHRHAFVIGKKHALFMVYIREGTKEAILCSDSYIEIHLINNFINKLKEIQKKFGINVFTNTDLSGRQADKYSCYADALIWGRDTTAIDPETGEYRMKNLIGILEQKDRIIRSEDGIFFIKIPNQLLKTSQISEFVNLHKQNDPTIKVHKGMTLDEFRIEHIDYLRQKGIKLSKRAEIQFYINEMEQEVGELSDVEKNQFKKAAKEHLKQPQPDLYLLAIDFLKLLQSNRGEYKPHKPPIRVYSHDLRDESLKWESVATEGKYSTAKSFLDDQSLILQLAKCGYLWECGNKDAFFAGALLILYPQHFTRNEAEALKWLSKYGVFQSKLCAQNEAEANPKPAKLIKMSTPCV